MESVKLKRGQKLCKSCGCINAARSGACKECKKVFVLKNSPIKNEIKDWRSLSAGDTFKVVQGTGPYYVCKRDSEEGTVGEKIYMGARGVYNRKNGGYDFVYMGEDQKASSGIKIIRKAHRIVRTPNKRKRKKV